jgi:hypothetical protein
MCGDACIKCCDANAVQRGRDLLQHTDAVILGANEIQSGTSLRKPERRRAHLDSYDSIPQLSKLFQTHVRVRSIWRCRRLARQGHNVLQENEARCMVANVILDPEPEMWKSTMGRG